jgi:hypothetical protein
LAAVLISRSTWAANRTTAFLGAISAEKKSRASPPAVVVDL